MRAFRHVGPVDIAYATNPFRANENDIVFLVNGTPGMIDVDNEQLLNKTELTKDPVYATLASQYPQISLWPADRHGTEYPLAQNLTQGEQRFMVRYRLRNECHACAVVGSAQFGFDFDQSGKFLGTKLLHVSNTP